MNDERKNQLKILASVLAVVVFIAASVHWGLPAYRHIKEKRSVAAAQVFLNHGDYRNAYLSAQLAFVLNSNNLAACRIMAGLFDLSGSPMALDWRQRIAQIQPTLENKLTLAMAGLRYQNAPFPLTTQTLDQLADTSTNIAEYQSVAAELALKMNRMADAQTHLETAVQLDPANKLFQLNLAVLRLNSTNPAVANDARGALKQFNSDTNFGAPALRSLVFDRLVHDDLPSARDYSTQLLANPQAGFADRLEQLTILKRMRSPDLVSQLNAVQQDAATNATTSAQTAAWMEANGFVPGTFSWLNTLPASVKNQTPVQLALVEYYLDTTNWQGLRQFTAKGDWGEMNFLRLAFLSRAWSELGEPAVADGNWHSAVDLAGNQFGALNALLQLANRWQMKIEQENLLQRILQQHPDAGWAQQNLQRFYMASGNTRSLYQLYSESLARSPQNAMLKNNLAATALLLKTNLSQAYQLASEAYGRFPGVPEVVSTYAYALHLQGRDNEGLAALQKLKPSQLEEPSVSLYYGVLLAALGENARAAHFFAIAEKNGQLMPEEKQLLATTGKME